MDLIAHKTEEGLEQTLSEHLKNVAERSAFFAESFCNADWAYFAGMLHDLGKADSDWQKYIRGEKSTSVNHSEAGAQFAYSKMDSKVIPYLIAGHHAGLPDWHEGSGNSLKSILEKSDISYLEKLLSNSKLKENVESFLPKSMPFGKNDLKKDNPQELLEHFHLWIRMLYSCLVRELKPYCHKDDSVKKIVAPSRVRELKRRSNISCGSRSP